MTKMFAQIGLALLALLAVSGPAATALRCNFEVTNSNSTVPSENESTKECKSGDDYCISFGGTVHNPVKDVTIQVRACERDLKDYIDPISKTIGKPIILSCKESSSKKDEKVGPFEYWYNCCQGDLCNNASTAALASPMFALAALSALIFARKFAA